MLEKLFQFSYLPSECLWCNRLHSSATSNICDPCFAKLPRLTPVCSTCASPTSKNVSVCGRCLNNKSVLYRRLAACHFQPPIDRWLRLLKDKGRLEPLPLFVALLEEKLKETLKENFKDQKGWHTDLVIPIPIAWDRRLIRGFNQTELIANALAKSQNLPVANNILIRSRRIKSQRGLSKAQRFSNQRNSFAVKSPEVIKGKNILLIDDIFTTGATAEYATKELKKAGAECVIFAAVARTSDPKD